MSYGANTGYAINPARDFGPAALRLARRLDGVALPGNYGNVNWYWWLPIVAPIVGGIIGALVYEFFISHVLRAREEPPASDVEVKGEVVEEL
jgi:glycerol uptake facilitator protein